MGQSRGCDAEVYGGSYRQRDQMVEEFASLEDGIEVLSLAAALAKYNWMGADFAFFSRRKIHVARAECGEGRSDACGGGERQEGGSAGRKTGRIRRDT